MTKWWSKDFTIKVPKIYKINIDRIESFADLIKVIETLNIQVSENLINDENKHLFKES